MYHLYIGNKNYSSWSLRPWVLLTYLGVRFEEYLEHFESDDNFDKFRAFSPSGTVPCLVDRSLVDRSLVDKGLVDEGLLVENSADQSNGRVIWDSLAICEYVAEQYPKVWPKDRGARAFARCAAAEMHSSFSSIRNICPMNCAITVDMKEITLGLSRDLSRIDEIWQEGLARFGGPFLAGDRFSAADTFFCPVALRLESYQLPVSAASRSYVSHLLGLPAMKAWVAAAVAESWRDEAHEKEAQDAGVIVADRR
ncbi:MAG: glutathione S-transferase [Candidatus Azotimanducaceae bacterium]|jgi:glutathione S-transferase